MKKNVILASFQRPFKERVDGKPVFSHHSFYLMALNWIKTHALSDSEIDSNFDLSIAAFDMDDSNELILKMIWEKRPTILSLSCYVWNIQRNLDLCRRLKLVLPDVKIILGGPEVCDYEFIFKRNPFIDMIVKGEGEETFKQILRSLQDNNRNIKGIAGLCISDNGSIIENESRPPLDLADLPSPYTKEFIDELSGLILYGTSRGCSSRCKYCSWCYSPRRYFPIEQVESELKNILSNKNIKCIWFSDSEIDLRDERTKQILKYIRDNNKYNTKMVAFFNFLGVDEESLRLCKDANFNEFPIIGLQSSKQKTLDIAGRKWFKIKELEKSLPLVRKYFPSVYLDLIHGLPGDSYYDFKQTLRWCLMNGIRNINFHRLMLTPGTEFSRNSKKYGFTFDKDVPHFSYSSDTYSYCDIVKMGTLADNFTVLMSVLKPEDYEFFKSNKIDLLETMEKIHESFPDWEDYFSRLCEFGIENIKSEVIELMKTYFRNVVKSDKLYGEILKLLAVRIKEREEKKKEVDVRRKEEATEGKDQEVVETTFNSEQKEMLRSYANEIIKPLKITGRFAGNWHLDGILVDSGIVFIFKWKSVSFRIKLVKRDDMMPRLSYTKNFNLFYIEEGEIEKIPEKERSRLLKTFIELATKNDIKNIII